MGSGFLFIVNAIVMFLEDFLKEIVADFRF